MRVVSFAVFAAAAVTMSACAHDSAAKTKPPVETPRVTSKIAFTSAAATDSLTVWTNNAEKPDGRAAFVVRDAKGRTVLSDSVSLAALDAENPVQTWTSDLAKERLWMKSQTLKEMEGSIVHPEESGVGVFWPVEQSEATLERAKTAGRPVLCYVNAPGGATCAWYDDAAGKGVPLLEGGV